MPKKMTESEFTLCKRTAAEIKAEVYANIGEKREQNYFDLYMGLDAEDREQNLDIMILLSEIDYITFRALDLIVQELRKREEYIPQKLVYWYIDTKSKRISAPKDREGLKNVNRDFAIAKCLHELNAMGMTISRHKQTNEEKKRGKDKENNCLSAADAIAEEFLRSYDTVVKIWDSLAQPDSLIYKRTPTLRRCAPEVSGDMKQAI